MLIKRRNFLKSGAVITAGTMLLPRFLAAARPGAINGRRLIVIQLSGGNDGLNTVIPYADDTLYNLRPNLAPAASEIIPLHEYAGLNKGLEALRDHYDNGDFCILNSVGYPNPTRSHFRSMDIWQSGSSSHEYLSTGWLGRYLDSECTGNEEIYGIEMGDVLSMALKGETYKGLPVSDIQRFYNATRSIHIEDDHSDHPMAAYLYKTLADTKSSAEYLYEKSRLYTSHQLYPQHEFGRKMKQMAELILSDVSSPVYYASLSGFDTHTRQKNRQSRLLKIYADSLHCFIQDLKQHDLWKDTLVLTFSEFGRRVAENAGKGTDHGKANTVFIAGGNLKQPGIYNGLPDLSQLDDGDLPHAIDFRQVYSTVLEKWLDADSNSILQHNFPSLHFI